ncbi:alanine acetyltransferase [Actinoplanes ianthinogenes]|uniref:Alanine acetyltransferase n=1 Tax=Actinoplanes ianthinogenes TaxID=122358 RepID=A0ABN6CGC1_9ACTN|nr:alanine acetyltransferase [Actinoplanes ianthinogenes]GGQ98807.1 alanine acetyltransferase [Actinoplanes ianthinogenes]
MRRFRVEPGLIGLDWNGFGDAGGVDRRFAENGCLSPEASNLIVEVEGIAVGTVQHREMIFSGRGPFQEIGIVLLPEFRGRGIGWRAQALLCAYLFQHWPIQRIQAGTHPENVAEQKSLVKAGFQREGTIRAAEFRAGEWRDGLLYSRLRTDPTPEI